MRKEDVNRWCGQFDWDLKNPAITWGIAWAVLKSRREN